MPNRRAVGREAEDLAANYLMGQGLTIVTRRFKAAHGEIDLVALDGDTLVFVEVKARYTNDQLPEESISQSKLTSMGRAAAEYRLKMEDTREFRFDVVAIDAKGIRHHRDILRD